MSHKKARYTDTFKGGIGVRPSNPIDPHSINFHKAADERKTKLRFYKKQYRLTHPEYVERAKQYDRVRNSRADRRARAAQWSKQNRIRKNELGRLYYKRHIVSYRKKALLRREIFYYIRKHSGYGYVTYRLMRDGIKPAMNFYMSCKKGIWAWTFAHP